MKELVEISTDPSDFCLSTDFVYLDVQRAIKLVTSQNYRL